MSLVPYITTPAPPISQSKNTVDKIDIYKNKNRSLKVTSTYLLSFRTAVIPAASAGKTCDGDGGLSEVLCELKLLEEALHGVPGRDEFGELTTDGGYHDCEEPSCGHGRGCWSHRIKGGKSSSISLLILKQGKIYSIS